MILNINEASTWLRYAPTFYFDTSGCVYFSFWVPFKRTANGYVSYYRSWRKR